MRDRELIERVQRQLPGAFEELYFAYVDRVQQQLHTVVGPDPDCKDLVQDTFTAVFKHIGGFRADSSFSTWLHRISLNIALGHLRKRRRARWHEPNVEADAIETLQDPASLDDAITQRTRLRQIYQILDRLKPNKRIAFVLYEIEGHTLEEVSRLVGSPLKTVAARVSAARREVRRTLERRLKSDAVVAA